MTTDSGDFVTETAKFMAADRPDVYSSASVAALDLAETMEKMRELDDDSWTSFTSYRLTRHVEDGVEEWFFDRKVSSLAIFYEEGEVVVFGHDDRVDLPGPSLEGLDDDLNI